MNILKMKNSRNKDHAKISESTVYMYHANINEHIMNRNSYLIPFVFQINQLDPTPLINLLTEE